MNDKIQWEESYRPVTPLDKKAIRFEERQAVLLARFIAELTREGLAYEVTELAGGWSVKITGF